MRRAILLSALLLASGVVAAKQDTALAIGDGSFENQRAKIEADLADGETYAEISRPDQRTVRETLDRMADVLAGVASVDELTDDAKTRLFNDQELVNTILTRAAADSRVVCDRTARTGTRFKTSNCATVAERRRRMEHDRDEMHRIQRGMVPLEQ